jgi:hypothetical protein
MGMRSVYIQMVKWIVAISTTFGEDQIGLSEDGDQVFFKTSATTLLDVTVQVAAL